MHYPATSVGQNEVGILLIYSGCFSINMLSRIMLWQLSITVQLDRQHTDPSRGCWFLHLTLEFEQDQEECEFSASHVNMYYFFKVQKQSHELTKNS